MADRRLLIAIATALVLASSTACTLGPIYTHHVAGRIVDRETREPIAGAEVFMSYEIYDTILGGNFYTDLRWTSTDQEGHFEFPAHWAIDFTAPFYATESGPDLRWIHPQYGHFAIERGGRQTPDRNYDWDNLELVMTREEWFIDMVNKGPDLFDLCSDRATNCRRACEVWFRDSGRCAKVAP